MKDGFVQIRREHLEFKDYQKSPDKFFAWIDLCAMAAWKPYTDKKDQVRYQSRGEVIASYGYLATRWKKSKGRVHDWIQGWIQDGRLERLPERCAKRDAERFLVLAYTEKGEGAERNAERQSERGLEPNRINQKTINKTYSSSVGFFEEIQRETFRPETEMILRLLEEECPRAGVRYDVDPHALDVAVSMYAGEVSMKPEIKQLIIRSTEKKIVINAERIANWFRSAKIHRKTYERRQKEKFTKELV